DFRVAGARLTQVEVSEGRLAVDPGFRPGVSSSEHHERGWPPQPPATETSNGASSPSGRMRRNRRKEVRMIPPLLVLIFARLLWTVLDALRRGNLHQLPLWVARLVGFAAGLALGVVLSRVR